MKYSTTADTNTERRKALQLYRDLNANEQIIFRSILEIAMILLKNMQEDKNGGN